MRLIETFDDIAEGIEALLRLDPRLGVVIEHAGDVPLRRSTPGFASLAGIVIARPREMPTLPT